MKKQVATTLQQVPMRNMNGQELKNRLLLFARRAKSLTGTGLDENGQVCSAPLGDSVSAFLETLANNLNDPKAIAARNEGTILKAGNRTELPGIQSWTMTFAHTILSDRTFSSE